MHCQEKDCQGKINLDISISLSTGCNCCFGRAIAYPCNQCGRLHWANKNSLVFNKADEAAFLESGHIIHKQPVDKN